MLKIYQLMKYQKLQYSYQKVHQIKAGPSPVEELNTGERLPYLCRHDNQHSTISLTTLAIITLNAPISLNDTNL